MPTRRKRDDGSHAGGVRPDRRKQRSLRRLRGIEVHTPPCHRLLAYRGDSPSNGFTGPTLREAQRAEWSKRDA